MSLQKEFEEICVRYSNQNPAFVEVCLHFSCVEILFFLKKTKHNLTIHDERQTQSATAIALPLDQAYQNKFNYTPQHIEFQFGVLWNCQGEPVLRA